MHTHLPPPFPLLLPLHPLQNPLLDHLRAWRALPHRLTHIRPEDRQLFHGIGGLLDRVDIGFGVAAADDYQGDVGSERGVTGGVGAKAGGGGGGVAREEAGDFGGGGFGGGADVNYFRSRSFSFGGVLQIDVPSFLAWGRRGGRGLTRWCTPPLLRRGSGSWGSLTLDLRREGFDHKLGHFGLFAAEDGGDGGHCSRGGWVVVVCWSAGFRFDLWGNRD